MTSRLVRGAIYAVVGFAFLAGLAGEAYGHHASHGHEHRTHCTCVGVCHGAAASPVPAKPDPRVAPSELAERSEHRPAARRLLPRTRRYVLPLANAPPGARSETHA